MKDIIKGEGYTQCIEGDDSIYTIGHSNHSTDEFLHLLQAHGITCVVDVRSIPASKHSLQYNQDILEGFLKYHHINYQFFGREFGARRTDSYNQQGQVDFELAVKTDLFQHGVKRINTLLEVNRVTLMCSEGENQPMVYSNWLFEVETKKRYNRICFTKTFWYFRRFLLKTFA